jgi:hypothetical protein
MTTVKEQKQRLTFIEELIETYNENQLKLENKPQRIILERHAYGCRCTTCWYQYDGPSRDKEPSPQTIYEDIHNSKTGFYKD